MRKDPNPQADLSAVRSGRQAALFVHLSRMLGRLARQIDWDTLTLRDAKSMADAADALAIAGDKARKHGSWR